MGSERAVEAPSEASQMQGVAQAESGLAGRYSDALLVRQKSRVNLDDDVSLIDRDLREAGQRFADLGTPVVGVQLISNRVGRLAEVIDAEHELVPWVDAVRVRLRSDL